MDKDIYDRAVAEYKRNKDIAQLYAQEAEDAARMADLVSNKSDQALYKDKTERALQAYKNFESSADLCLEVMQEIMAGLPRRADE